MKDELYDGDKGQWTFAICCAAVGGLGGAVFGGMGQAVLFALVGLVAPWMLKVGAIMVREALLILLPWAVLIGIVVLIVTTWGK